MCSVFRFFQILISRKPDQLKLNRYPEDRVRKFWKLSSSIQNFTLKTIAISSAITISFIVTSSVIMMWKYSRLLPFLAFCLILILNYLSLLTIGTMNLTIAIGMITYLYLVCKILRERYDIISSDLNRLVRKKIDLHKLKALLNDFNLVVDDLQRCDYFWSKFIFWNYHMAVVICSILFLFGIPILISMSTFFNVDLMAVLSN